MGCCNHGPLYFVSSIFLLLGGVGIVFGFASGLWYYATSLWLACPNQNVMDCKVVEDIKGGIWIAQMTLLCAAVAFAVFAFIVMFLMCCCCMERRGTMFTLKFFFMLISGVCSGACVVWFALNIRGTGVKAWADWDAFTASPKTTYGYYVECAGAAFMLLGSIFAILGRCCCDYRD